MRNTSLSSLKDTAGKCNRKYFQDETTLTLLTLLHFDLAIYTQYCSQKPKKKTLVDFFVCLFLDKTLSDVSSYKSLEMFI